MNVNLISDELFSELSEDSSISIPSINMWLRSNIGSLNNAIASEYAINTTNGEITPELGENEKSIYKLMYNLYFYDKKIRENLGAAGYESVLEVDSDNTKIKLVNRTELGKSYLQAKRLAVEELKSLINGYAIGQSIPLQVPGSDTLSPYPYPPERGR